MCTGPRLDLQQQETGDEHAEQGRNDRKQSQRVARRAQHPAGEREYGLPLVVSPRRCLPDGWHPKSVLFTALKVRLVVVDWHGLAGAIHRHSGCFGSRCLSCWRQDAIQREQRGGLP